MAESSFKAGIKRKQKKANRNNAYLSYRAKGSVILPCSGSFNERDVHATSVAL